IEVAWLAGMMAAEIGADVKLAKRMGLLHDIGKALTHEQDGSHPELSLQVLTKYNESPAVINAALAGHANIEPTTVEAVLVEAEMQYPGHIKVVVIRETRAVEVAR